MIILLDSRAQKLLKYIGIALDFRINNYLLIYLEIKIISKFKVHSLNCNFYVGISYNFGLCVMVVCLINCDVWMDD